MIKNLISKVLAREHAIQTALCISVPSKSFQERNYEIDYQDAYFIWLMGLYDDLKMWIRIRTIDFNVIEGEKKEKKGRKNSMVSAREHAINQTSFFLHAVKKFKNEIRGFNWVIMRSIIRMSTLYD